MRFLSPLRHHITTTTITNSHPNQTPTTLFKSFHHYHPTQLINLLTKATQTLTLTLSQLAQIHTQLLLNGHLSSPIPLTNLLNSYSKCGHLAHSLLLFAAAPDASKNVVTWTSVISQLTRFHEPFKALSFFGLMRSGGVSPNECTFSALLRACADVWVVANGGQVHCLALKHGVGSDLFVGSGLVAMYSKYGCVGLAETVFEEMPERNLVCWNAMIVGYLHNECFGRAIGLFRELIGGVPGCVGPDEVSFSSVLSACANWGELVCGKQVHGLVIKHGMLHLAHVNCSLMDMYCKCRVLDDAVCLFRTVGGRYLVAWNVMIAGLSLNDKLEEAGRWFSAMTRGGVLPDEASYSSVLHASGSLASSVQGSVIHDHVMKFGFVNSVFVTASLIMMYSKSGHLVEAYQVFEEMKDRNLICWTAIIAACQQHGCGSEAIGLFEEMLEQRIKPGYETYASVISACSHTGRVEEGFSYFNSMTEVFGMALGHEHYACMVDLLGRAGQLSEAKEFIEAMPIEARPEAWRALLCACTNHGNLVIGEEAAGRLFGLEPSNPEDYVLLSDLYARYGKPVQAGGLIRSMGEKGLRKEPGSSWLEIMNSTFVFTDYDTSNPRTGEMYQMLESLRDLGKRRGYSSETHPPFV